MELGKVMLSCAASRGALFLMLLPFGAAGAQEADAEPPPEGAVESSQPAKQPPVHSFLHDEYQIWTAPFRPSNLGSHGMKKYGVPFLLISAATIATDRKTSEVLPNTQDQEIWSGRVSQAGASYTLAGFAGGMYLIGKARGDSHLKESGFLGLQAFAHTQLVAYGLKQITQRERPAADRRRIGFWRGGDSFPSGHASTTFAVATVFAYEYRERIAVPITAYSVASLVAASRVSARRHWVSDIFAGGAGGFMIGRFVYKQHHDPNLSGSPVERKSRLVPEVGVAPVGFLLSWHL